MSAHDEWREETVAVVSILVLGAGFVAMYFGASWFWMVWVLGFVVVMPLLSILLDVDEDSESEPVPGSEAAVDGGGAHETLRERYARGELTDEQFERKLERLLETETIEDVHDAGRSSRANDRGGHTPSQREHQRER